MNFNKMYPKETIQLLDVLCNSFTDILKGEYDFVAKDCMSELANFKIRYSNRRDSVVDIGDIGMEDYFLILHLVYLYNRRVSQEKQYFSIFKEREAAECFRDLCLTGIYNVGRINLLNKKYSKKFIHFLNSFDNIFTTNYDSNLERACNRKVEHIHGQFDILHELYDPNSFRNSLSDHQLLKNNLINISGYEYLHSTALMNYSGINKYREIVNRNNLDMLTRDDIERLSDGTENKSLF